MEVPAVLTLSDLPPRPARAEIVERDKSWRTRAALRELAIWWLPILVFIWIPLVHLIAVPLLLVVGAWRAITRMREGSTLAGLHGTCPKCGTEQDWPGGGRVPSEVQCVHCQWDLHLRLGQTADLAAGGQAPLPAPA